MTLFEIIQALGQISSDALDRAEGHIKKSVEILHNIEGK